jgi:hypothetical protein
VPSIFGDGDERVHSEMGQRGEGAAVSRWVDVGLTELAFARRHGIGRVGVDGCGMSVWALLILRPAMIFKVGHVMWRIVAVWGMPMEQFDDPRDWLAEVARGPAAQEMLGVIREIAAVRFLGMRVRGMEQVAEDFQRQMDAA